VGNRDLLLFVVPYSYGFLFVVFGRAKSAFSYQEKNFFSFDSKEKKDSPKEKSAAPNETSSCSKKETPKAQKAYKKKKNSKKEKTQKKSSTGRS